MAATAKSAAEFVKVYLTATTLDEAAETLGLKRGYVRGRAASLGKKGVNLPEKFKGERVGQKLDVAGLNTLVEELTQPQPTKGGRKGK